MYFLAPFIFTLSFYIPSVFRLKCSFVPIRKKGKLPGDCLSANFNKEYGADALEIQAGSVKKKDNVVIIDDLLATGGTLEAAYSLLIDEKIQANVLVAMVVIELDALKGRDRLNKQGLSVHGMIHY